MRPAPKYIAITAILLAAFLAFLSATQAVQIIEERAARETRRVLSVDGIEWADVVADGLTVHLRGTAPNEAARFRALSLAGSVIDSERVLDEIDILPSQPIAPPHFSVELLRNDAGISMIGLIPAGQERETILETAQKAAGAQPVTDMLETANYPVPSGWKAALKYGLYALSELPRSKVSISAEKVSITAISDSPKDKRDLETSMARKVPDGLPVEIHISAPRPVLTPFTLRFVMDQDGTRFDACSADSPESQARILNAAVSAGLEHKAECIIGLGVPSPRWAEAVELGLQSLTELGGGTLTFSDADVTLVALQDTTPATFAKVTRQLNTSLPPVFSLHSVLPKPIKIDGTGDGEGTPEFVATKSPEGLVQIRGRITNELVRKTTQSYAHARFGMGQVHQNLRIDETLPEGWPIRVLTAIEALSLLNNGVVVVQPEFVQLNGTTGDASARANITQLFAEKLGDAQNYEISVSYEETLDPLASLPTPEECVTRIKDILTAQKISFAPGSVSVEGEALQVVDKISEVLKECPDVEMQIEGHTDSQGREELNESLSQQRADAVLDALMARRILTANLTAKGFGESQPIADNGSEDGREANRRIEFTLARPAAEQDTPADGADTSEPEAAVETTGDTDEQN